MRGFVYRLGRRRAGSVLAALAVALTFALGSGSPALAWTKRGFGAAPAHISSVSSARASGKSARTQDKPVPVAHAAGHKIA